MFLTHPLIMGQILTFEEIDYKRISYRFNQCPTHPPVAIRAALMVFFINIAAWLLIWGTLFGVIRERFF